MFNFSDSAINNIKKIVNQKNFKRILILSGEKSYKYSGARHLLDQVLVNKETYFFFKKSSFPEITELKKISLYLKVIKPDLFIAIGGGSVIDYAKIANSLNFSKDIKKQIINSTYKKIKKFTKLLAIPTTAGSGAEVTANAVIYISKIKYSVEFEELKPDYFILVPDLILNSKMNIKSSAGFDAIAQAIESIISKKSTNESVDFALRSLKISLKHYLDHLKKPNFLNSYKMCIAANYSGKAISISKTTAPHALSYPFTSHFGIKHGHAVSLTLNDFLKFNINNIKHANCSFDLKSRYKKLYNLTKTSNINELDHLLEKIKYHAGLENNFKKLKIDIKKEYSKIIDGVNIQRLSNNPVKIKKEDIKFILLNK